MPGNKKVPKSIKAPRLYERLKTKHGMAKGKAARLSNWLAKRGKVRRKWR